MKKQIRMRVPYFQVPNSIFDLNLSSFELVVYIYLCRCGNRGQTAFPSYNTIAKKCGISRRKAIYVIKELEEKGFIKKVVRISGKNENASNLYEVVIPDDTNVLGSEEHALGSEQYASANEQCAPYKEINNKEINYKEIDNDNGAFAVAESTMYAFTAIKYYFLKYEELFGTKHPRLKPAQHKKVLSTLATFETEQGLSLEDWQNMIDRHFSRNINTDYNINHFATEGILQNLLYDIGFY